MGANPENAIERKIRRDLRVRRPAGMARARSADPRKIPVVQRVVVRRRRVSRPVAGQATRRMRKRIDNITRDSDSYRAQNGAEESVLAPPRRRRKRLSLHAFSVLDALSSAPPPSSTLDRLISGREQGRLRCSGNQNAAPGCPCTPLSSGPEPCPGTHCRGPAAGVAFRLLAAWASCAHLQVVPCLHRGYASPVRWERSPLRPVAFSDAVHWRCLSASAAAKQYRPSRSPFSAPPC